MYVPPYIYVLVISLYIYICNVRAFMFTLLLTDSLAFSLLSFSLSFKKIIIISFSIQLVKTGGHCGRFQLFFLLLSETKWFERPLVESLHKQKLLVDGFSIKLIFNTKQDSPNFHQASSISESSKQSSKCTQKPWLLHTKQKLHFSAISCRPVINRL